MMRATSEAEMQNELPRVRGNPGISPRNPPGETISTKVKAIRKTYTKPQTSENNTEPINSAANSNSFPGRISKSFQSIAMTLQNRNLAKGTATTAESNNDQSHSHFSDEEGPTSTDPKLKSDWFLHTLSTNLSYMYAILLFLIGCVLYLADILEQEKRLALGAAFNVALMIVQLVWFAYIHIDVRRYINSITTSEGVQNDPTQSETNIGRDVSSISNSNIPKPKETLPQKYGFTSGRHGGSLYLKIGAVIFCLGYLIHTGLNLVEKVIHFMSGDRDQQIQHILLTVLQPIYAFNQLYFIFKYSNLIINVRRRLSKFALMQSIATSLLFWVNTIAQETLHDIHASHAHGKDADETMTDSTHGAISTKHKFSEYQESEIIHKISNITPYLYPFSIEYNILIVGFWILLWENVGKIDRNTHLPTTIVVEDDSHNPTPTISIAVDCNHTNRGLFAGILMAVASATSIILLFVFSIDEKTLVYGQKVNRYTEFTFLAIMAVAAIIAYIKIRQLDLTVNLMSNIDDIMLYICLPCIFLYSVFSMIPAIEEGKPHYLLVSVSQVIQVIIQTALISDGLRRCSNTRSLVTKKPGREFITFLIVANLALWLLETFQIKTEAGNLYKYKYYGKKTWILLSHITLPMALFYRFHSSVCLVDIWKGGYERDTKH